MSSAATLLILASAALHVAVHVAIKQSTDRLAFTWWIWVWGCILFLPVPLLCWTPLSPAAWGNVAASAALGTLYYVAMARAYTTGDLSLVYPLCRGTSPILTLAWSAALLGERPSAGGIAGILAIAAGLVVVNLPRPGAVRAMLESLGQPAARWALLGGVCTSCCTVVDRLSVERVPPELYIYLATVMTTIGLTPVILAGSGIPGLLAEWRRSRLRAVCIGGVSMLVYLLLLLSMHAGATASYAGSVREISVVFGALAGVYILREPSASTRLAGSAMVAAGAAAIVLGG